MQVSRRMLMAAIWLYGFLAQFVFFNLFVAWAYSGESDSPFTNPLVGVGLGILGGLYLALTLSGLSPGRTRRPESSTILLAGCFATLAALLTFATYSVMYSACFALRHDGSLLPLLEHFVLACISFGFAVFGIWFLYSIPFGFAFGALAGKLLLLLSRGKSH